MASRADKWDWGMCRWLAKILLFCCKNSPVISLYKTRVSQVTCSVVTCSVDVRSHVWTCIRCISGHWPSHYPDCEWWHQTIYLRSDSTEEKKEFGFLLATYWFLLRRTHFFALLAATAALDDDLGLVRSNSRKQIYLFFTLRDRCSF